MGQKLQFAAAWLVVELLGRVPRPVARSIGAGLGWLAFACLPRLRGVGMKNLAIAFPSMPARERRQVLRGMYRSLGWQLAEFCRISRSSLPQASQWIRYEGLEHFTQAEKHGKGVLVLTGHIGAWELSSFFHSLAGHPMGIVIRRLDNPRVDRLVNGIRCRHGNHILDKDNFARGLIAAMRSGETVGVLMDTNMTPPQGIFVDFFGLPACTASGVARVATRTGAAVLPGFLVWEKAEKRYVLHFLPPVEIENTGNEEHDAMVNTQRFTHALEQIIRRYPEQWLWVHRRWKTRPAGEPPLY